MKKSARTVNRFGVQAKRTKTMVRGLSSAMGALGVGLGVGGVAMGVRSMVRLASAAEEVESKFKTVFKGEAEAASGFAKSLGSSLGRAETSLKGFLATLQDTFVPLGFGRREAREMSETLTRLAIDLASFNNTTESNAIRDLQSAIVGNHETMRKYGVIITQRILDQKLLALGFQKVVHGASEQAKAMARVQIIMAGTADAQGDAARTANSYANQVRRLSASWTDFGEVVGSQVIPALSSMMEHINTAAKAVKDFRESSGLPATQDEANRAAFWQTDVREFVLEGEIAEREKENQAERRRVRRLRKDMVKRKALEMIAGETAYLDRAEAMRSRADMLPGGPQPQHFVSEAQSSMKGLDSGSAAVSDMHKMRTAAFDADSKKMEAMADQASSLFDATRTPFERFKAEIEGLDNMLAAGVVTWGLYGRGVRAARDALKSGLGTGGVSGAEFRVVKSLTMDVRGLSARKAGAADPMLKKTDKLIAEAVKTNENLQKLQAGGGLR